jgi:putative two-component system response regulator
MVVSLNGEVGMIKHDIPIPIVKPKVLIVDDYTDNLFTLSRVLKELEVDVYQAASGEEALGLTIENDFCVAILDVQMPGMDGYELAELLRGNESTSKLPIIFLSAAFSDEYHHRKGYDAGAVDFLSKPYNRDILLSKVRVFINLYEQRLQIESWGHWLEFLVHERTTELSQSYDDTLLGWAKALELRERETAGHCHRVTQITMRMANEIGISAEQQVHIQRGALLHDIGKMGISDSILLKPASLTTEEWGEMRQHPIYAYELLRHVKFLEPALNIPYTHHEKWDGTGYPRGLKGEDIPLEARIFALADVWDALTSDRPYRKAVTRDEVVQYIRDHSGTHFDPNLSERFIKMMLRDSADNKSMLK